MEKDKDIAEAVSLDSDTQTQLAASFEKAIGVDTPKTQSYSSATALPTDKSKNTDFKKQKPLLTKTSSHTWAEATKTAKKKPYS